MEYTTIEQSRKLIGLGLAPETADLWLTEFQPLKPAAESCLQLVPDGEKTVSVSLCRPEKIALASYKYTPSWSTDALLAVIPHTGYDGIELNNYSDGKCVWMAAFRWGSGFSPIRLGFTPFEAVYETVCCLLENGHIRKEE